MIEVFNCQMHEAGITTRQLEGDRSAHLFELWQLGSFRQLHLYPL
jgi:hypothetical protein